METNTLQQRDSEVYEQYIKRFMDILVNDTEHTEFIRTGSRTFIYSVLDEERKKRYVEISFEIPSDKRNDGYFDLSAEVEKYECLKREKSEIKQAKLAIISAKKNRDKQRKKGFSHS